jgi:anti-sigma regulatory factor (Ser/Thr protein kinase)
MLMTAASCAGDPALIDRRRSDPARFEHSVLFYRGSDHLLEAVVAFVRDGLATGGPVLVALPRPRLTLVRDALGTAADRVDLWDVEAYAENPARLLAALHEFVDGVDGERPVHAVSESAWPGRRTVEFEEAALHEALLNVAFDDGPAWRLLCPYDAVGLPSYVRDQALRTHPGSRGRSGPATYAGHRHALEQFAAPLPPVPPTAARVWFGYDDLAVVRRSVAELAGGAGLSKDTGDEIVLAAHELASNSVVHGGGAGVLYVWGEPGALVVQVSDRGTIDDPLVGRERLQDLSDHGRGIWMANQLCDLVQVRSSRAGTQVRIYTWL